jgi:hypothetical protein
MTVAQGENPWVPAAGPGQGPGGVATSSSSAGPAIAHRPEVTPSIAPASAAAGALPQAPIPSWSQSPYAHLGGDAAQISGAGWWWLGVHGGAGVSTLAEFLPGGADAQRLWPPAPHLSATSDVVILVCRTHLSGLGRARDAIAQWQAGGVPTGLQVAGLVAVADAPGAPPRAAAEALRYLSGVLRTWTIPWLEDLRWGRDILHLPLPPPFVRIAGDLAALQPVARRGATPLRGPAAPVMSGSRRRRP